MKHNLHILVACLLVSVLPGIPYVKSQGFEKSYGGFSVDAGYAVVNTSDGGFVLAGSTSSYGNGGNDVFIIKTNSVGNILWSRVIGGTGNDVAYAVAKESNGNIIVAGQTNSFGAGGTDIYLIKLGKNGDLLWTKTIGGTGNETAKALVYTNGKYYLTGSTTGSGAGGSDVYFVKTDTSGNVLWSKTYGYAGDDYANALDVTYDGKFVLAGRTTHFGITSPVYVVKCKSNGDTLWTRNFFMNNSSNSNTSIQATGVKELNDHNYIVTGSGYPHNGGYPNMFHLKLDLNGNTIYSKWPGLLSDGGNGVTKTSDGGYVVADYYCNYGCRIRLIKYNSAGTLVWQKDHLQGLGLTYNDYSNGYAVKELPDGGFIASGYTNWTSGGNDALLIKTDSNGVSNTYTAPVITANGPTSVCSPNTVVLTAPPGYLRYKWIRLVGNGNFYLDTTASITISTTGQYYCVLTGASGIFASTVIGVSVSTSPTATVTASGPLNFCSASGQTLILTASGGLTYQWNLNGSPIAGATLTTYSVINPGSYTVTTVNGCGTANSSANIVNPSLAPSSIISCVTGICDIPQGCSSNPPPELSVSDFGSGTTYDWKLNGSSQPSGTTTFYPVSAGNYSCVISNSCGTSTSAPYAVNYLPPPVYNIFTSGFVGCGTSSMLLNAPTSQGSMYQWYLNGSMIIGATTDTYLATQAGNYTVDFYLFPCGIITSQSLSLALNSSAPATISAGGATQICSGSVTLTASVTGGSYSWRKDGVTISGAYSQTYNAASTGVYSCFVYNPQCGYSTSNNITVIVGSPNGTVTASSANICTGSFATLSFVTARTGFTYQWKNNNVAVNGATASTYQANATGSYTCVVTNTCGTFTSNAVALTVNSIPTATVTVQGSTALCQGNTATLSANTGAGYLYQWYKNNSPVSGATQQTYGVTSVGNYKVRVSNAAGCSATSTPDVVFTSLPGPVATAIATGYPQICEGQPIALKATTNVSYSYQWTKNSVVITSATDSLYNATGAGYYAVKVTNACGTVTSNTITVTKYSKPSAVITPAGPTTFCAGGSVVLNANIGTSLSYQWKRNGVWINGTTANNYLATQQGTYKVNVINLHGCSNTSAGTFVSVPCREDEQEINSESVLLIYPNPNEGLFTIKTFDTISEVTIFNALGQCIYSVDAVSLNEIKITLTEIPKGIYLVKLIAPDGTVHVRKIVLQ